LNNYFSKNFVVGVLGLGMKSNEVGWSWMDEEGGEVEI
jgi:hypothetical protein